MLKIQKLALLPELVTMYSQEAIARWDAVDARILYHRGADTWKYGFTDCTSYDRKPSQGGEVENKGIVKEVRMERRRSHGGDASDDEVKTPGKSLRTVQNEDPQFHKEDSGGHNNKYGTYDDFPLGKKVSENALLKQMQGLEWKQATFDDHEKFSRIAVLDNEWGEVKFPYVSVSHVFHGDDSPHTSTVRIADCEVRVIFSSGVFEIQALPPHAPLNIVVLCDTAVVDGFLDRDDARWRDKLFKSRAELQKQKRDSKAKGCEKSGCTVEVKIGTVQFALSGAAVETTDANCPTPLRNLRQNSAKANNPMKRPAAANYGQPAKKR